LHRIARYSALCALEKDISIKDRSNGGTRLSPLIAMLKLRPAGAVGEVERLIPTVRNLTWVWQTLSISDVNMSIVADQIDDPMVTWSCYRTKLGACGSVQCRLSRIHMTPFSADECHATGRGIT
jgi:hypothetical protein